MSESIKLFKKPWDSPWGIPRFMFSQAAKRDYSNFSATLCEFAWGNLILYRKWSQSESLAKTSFSPDFVFS